MPEPKPAGQVDDPQVTPPVEPAKELTIDEIRAENETLKKTLELQKTDLSGKDRKLTDLQKDLKARMTEEERIKSQAEDERKEWLSDIAKTKAESLQLDDKHSALIKGNSKEEINQSAELVKSLLDKVNQEKDKTIKALEDKIKILEANGSPIKKGISGDQKIITEAQFNAMNPRDHAAFFANGGTISN